MVTEQQLKNLALGRQKGTNHLTGIPKSESHRAKMKKIMADWCRQNPDKVKARGMKLRAERHYHWKGGVTRLNVSIRQMNENRKWMEAVKKRDGKCQVCGDIRELEADHIIPLANLLEKNKITNRDEARNCPALWDIKNGMTLCRRCHCKKDNKRYTPTGKGKRQRNDN